jgi:hypothetical protein
MEVRYTQARLSIPLSLDFFPAGAEKHLGGSFAEYLVADPRLLARIPDDYSFEDAAQLGISGWTASLVLFSKHPKPNPTEPSEEGPWVSSDIRSTTSKLDVFSRFSSGVLPRHLGSTSYSSPSFLDIKSLQLPLLQITTSFRAMALLLSWTIETPMLQRRSAI